MQQARGFNQRCHARGVIQGAVVDGVLGVCGGDADVIEVGGEDDGFVFELRVRAGHYPDHVGRIDVVDGRLGFSPQRKARRG